MSERTIRNKLKRICEDLDRRDGRSGSPGLRGALWSVLLGTGLVVGACGDKVETRGGTGGSAAAAGWTGTGGGSTSSAYMGPTGGWGSTSSAYMGPTGGWGSTGGGAGGWGGWGGEGGEGGGGGAGGDAGAGGT